MESKHKQIENMINEKLNSNCDESEKRKFEVLQKVISDKEQTLFDKISIDTAKAILMQLGIKEDEWFETYIELKEEESNRAYTLVDNETEDKGEER